MMSQMEREKADAYLIDLVPNLRFLLKINSLIKNGEEELEVFEQQVCVTFWLKILDTALLHERSQYHAMPFSIAQFGTFCPN
jgi:hypothetical protein